jgi:hypothetical protein
MKNCPACSRQVQGMEVECPHCGVIFAKLIPRLGIFPKDSVTPISDNTFTFSKSDRRLYLVCNYVSGGILFFTLFIPFINPDFSYWFSILGLIFFGPLYYLTLDRWRHRYDYFEVDERGITYVSKNGLSNFLPWENISCFRQNDLLQRLGLYDRLGHRAMSLHYDLENFDQLRNIIHKRTRHLWEKHSLQRVFNRPVFYYVIVIFIILLESLVGLFFKSEVMWIGLTLLAGMIVSWLIIMFAGIRKIKVEPSSITLLRYSFSKKVIPYHEIRDISIETCVGNAFGGGDKITMVSIKLFNGKIIQLSSEFKGGEDVLFDSLRFAWATAFGIRP